MPSPETSTSQVSNKLGLELVWHTLNTADLVLNISCNTVSRGWAGGFFMPIFWVESSVQKCHGHVKIVDMSDERTDQSMRTTLLLLILARCDLALSS